MNNYKGFPFRDVDDARYRLWPGAGVFVEAPFNVMRELSFCLSVLCAVP
jgi:hypothetical protein